MTATTITQKVLRRMLAGGHIDIDTIKTGFGYSNPSHMMTMLVAKGVPIERTRINGKVFYSVSQNISTTDRIRCRLLAGETLSTETIRETYGITGSASVIYELRNRGLDIKTKRERTASGGNMAHYYL